MVEALHSSSLVEASRQSLLHMQKKASVVHKESHGIHDIAPLSRDGASSAS